MPKRKPGGYDRRMLSRRMKDRRAFIAGAGGLAAGALLPLPARGQPPRLRFADMHSHHGMIAGRKNGQATRLADDMRASGLAAVAMKVIADWPVLAFSPGRITAREARSNGQFRAFFEATAGTLKGRAAREGLDIGTAAAHVDRALQEQKPSIVIAAEGADFLEGDLGYLKTAKAAGLAHLQLIHFRINECGDTATEKPLHGGLTDFGLEAIRECNRLGIVVDVAHCTHRGIVQALETSKKPIVYSHGWTSPEQPAWDQRNARAIHSPLAKAIAGEGGVVGIFPIQRSIAQYAAALHALANAIGPDHAGMGVDLDGLSRPAISTYGDLPELVRELGKLGMQDAAIDKVLGGNYLRVLRQALALDSAKALFEGRT